jgi:predicted transcriptional regulator
MRITNSKSKTFLTSENQTKQLKKQAEIEDRSESAVIRAALNQYLNQNKQQT